MPAQLGKHPADTRIIELARNSRVDGNIFVCRIERGVIALPLFSDIAQRIFGAAFVVFVENNKVREVQHINFFQLARCTVLAGHYVGGEINEVNNLTITLPDTGCLDDDQVEAERLEIADVIAKHFARGEMLAARCHRAHEYSIGAQRVHANAIAEQCATCPATCWIHGKNRDIHVWKTGQESIE